MRRELDNAVILDRFVLPDAVVPIVPAVEQLNRFYLPTYVVGPKIDRDLLFAHESLPVRPTQGDRSIVQRYLYLCSRWNSARVGALFVRIEYGPCHAIALHGCAKFTRAW